MTESKTGSEQAGKLSIARQPIFDHQRRLWGYKLYLVGTEDGASHGGSQTRNVAMQVASSAYMDLQQMTDRDKKVLVSFSAQDILENVPYALPAEMTVVQLTEATYHQPLVPPLLKQLKKDGYMLCAAGFSADKNCDALYRLADVISLDVHMLSEQITLAALTAAKAYEAAVLAMNVNNMARFNSCSRLGFDLFHGAFFKLAEQMAIRKLSSNEVARFNLMRTIQQEEVDFEQLAETIQSDVSLSFRLLSYLNSAAFGFRQKIKTVQQAIALLGWRKMKHWLRIVLLNDVNQSPDAPELMTLAVQRGKFLELIAQKYDFWGFDPESLHLLGIFSLLDAMLGTSMKEIVAFLPLDEKLKDALCRDPKSEYLPLLELSECFEEGRWQDAEAMVGKLNMDCDVLLPAFQQAVHWAHELTSVQGGQATAQ